MPRIELPLTNVPQIRVATREDAAGILAIYNPIVRGTAISFEIIPPTVAEMENRIVSTLVTHPWLVYEQDNRILGYAYASAHRVRAAYRWATDVSAYVDAESRGRGIARQLYTLLFDVLRELSFATALAGITLPNRASVALHESMGFQHLGIYRNIGFKLGAWHDVGWWQMVLATPVGEPAEPRAFQALVNEEETLRRILLR